MSSTSLISDEAHGALKALAQLAADDVDLIVELVLQSGSLKGLAGTYGVSYPTIRTRLNRVIGHLRAALAGHRPDPVRELLAQLVEGGELSPSGARAIVDMVEDERKGAGR